MIKGSGRDGPYDPPASSESDLMNRDDMLARIKIDPNVCSGKPWLRGPRIRVSLVLDFLRAWSSRVLEHDTGLEEAEIRAFITSDVEMSRERYTEIGG